MTKARQVGFDTAGIAAVPVVGSREDEEERRRFEAWIGTGSAGEMEYLKRRNDAGELVRSSLRAAVPWARSVVVCALNYETAQPHSTEPSPEGTGWIARYAWTRQSERPSDYHKIVLKRLKALEAELQVSFGPFESRCYVDTGPLVERVYAKYAGVGWVGKNTCILNQKLGSWLFLGVILTSMELPEEDRAQIAEDRCGSCRRCIEACPTDALVAPYQMDANRCIAYLTIEKRGEIPPELREGMGRQVFGCDICQDVCPWNRKAPVGRDADLRAREELVNPALEWLGALSEEEFGRIFYGSPVSRAKFSGLRRNVAIAMGNSGLRRFLAQLEAWSQADDAVLAEAARWAAGKIENSEGPDRES